MPGKIESLLTIAQEKSASDLHLNVERQPVIRVDGKLQKVENYPPLGAKEIHDILVSIVSLEQMNKFLNNKELDFSNEPWL